MKSPNDWMPYHDCVNFELTEFLYRTVQISAGSIDTLSQLICATLITHGTGPDNIDLFARNDDLLAKIDTTVIGDVPWQGFTTYYDGPHPDEVLEWMTTGYNVWHHDPQQIMHNLLANRDFNGDFDCSPFQEFNTGKRQHY